MVQLNTIVGSIGLFVLGVSAGPCRPTDTTTTVVTTEPATATTDLATATATATATTAPVVTTSTVPEGETACSIENPQYGGSGGEYEVYCDSFAGSTTPLGGIYFADSLSKCLDHCDETTGCVGVNYITTNVPYCSIWSSAGTFGKQKGVILAKRVVATTVEPTAP